MTFQAGHTPWNKGKKGVQKAWNKGKDGYLAGKKHYNWKGGKKMRKGYQLIRVPDHPNRDNQNYVPEHRLVVEKVIGRYLTSDEIVHHINEVMTDNRPENLYIFDKRWQHAVYHRQVKRGKVEPITRANLAEYKV